MLVVISNVKSELDQSLKCLWGEYRVANAAVAIVGMAKRNTQKRIFGCLVSKILVHSRVEVNRVFIFPLFGVNYPLLLGFCRKAEMVRILEIVYSGKRWKFLFFPRRWDSNNWKIRVYV